MSDRDPLARQIESANCVLDGTADKASKAADSFGYAVADLVEAVENLTGILDDTIARLIEVEAIVKALEAANDRRESYEQEQGERQ